METMYAPPPEKEKKGLFGGGKQEKREDKPKEKAKAPVPPTGPVVGSTMGAGGAPSPRGGKPLAGATLAGRLSVVPRTARWTRTNPFSATVERVQKITGLESAKDVYHVELSLEDAGLDYEPGDSLGIWAPNDHALVDEVLAALAIDPQTPVTIDQHRHTLHELLTRYRELTRLSPDTVVGYARQAGREDLAQQFESLDESGRRDFIERRQFIDLVSAWPPAGLPEWPS